MGNFGFDVEACMHYAYSVLYTILSISPAREEIFIIIIFFIFFSLKCVAKRLQQNAITASMFNVHDISQNCTKHQR